MTTYQKLECPICGTSLNGNKECKYENCNLRSALSPAPAQQGRTDEEWIYQFDPIHEEWNILKNNIYQFQALEESSAKEICDKFNRLAALSEGKTETKEIIDYIENDAEIQIPIERFFNEDKSHITKQQYGKVMIEILCQELREKFIPKTTTNE